MQIIKFKITFFSDLAEIYPETEIQSFFYILVEFRLKLSRIDVALNSDYEINTFDLNFLQNALIDLKQQKPIQYIIGETEFYNLPFKVNEHVLIPRPETEELVDWIVSDSKLKTQHSILNILDIGTGSGCIPISIAKNLQNVKLNAIDISQEALKTANTNALLNNVNLQLIEKDILNTYNLPELYDVIVSNPPYVRELEKLQMQKNVLENEPHLALFVEDNNPLLFYDKIADLAKSHLTKTGLLYFEINEFLGKETVDLLYTKGYKNIELRKDIFGTDRMIKATND